MDSIQPSREQGTVLTPQDILEHDAVPSSNAEDGNNAAPIVAIVQAAMRQMGVRLTVHEVTDGMPKCPALDDPAQSETAQDWLLQTMLRRGMSAAWKRLPLAQMGTALMPAVLQLRNGMAVVCQRQDKHFLVILPMLGDSPVRMTHSELEQAYSGQALLFKQQAHVDNRADDLISVEGKHWFWNTIWGFKRYIAEAAALSLIINILALSLSLFTMTVYNRVLPNQAYVTLWTMAIGVGIALVFELSARVARAWVLDRAGKKVDLVLGARIYRQVLATRLESRAQSSGAFANIVGSFDMVREFVTSASLTAVADLPFSILFLVVIYIVGGPLVWVVLGAMIVVSLIALYIQIPMHRHTRETHQLSTTRHGLIVESLDNLETIKALRAEHVLAAKHDAASVQLARLGMQSRQLSSTASTLIQGVQQATTVLIMLWGAHLVGEGVISMGAIIATVMLTGRTLMPISVLSNLAMRFQTARSAMESLNKVMSAPVERDPDRTYMQASGWKTEIECRNASFRYKSDLPPAIESLDLRIKAGERVAILGRMGSGKSTLLRLLVGLYTPTSGDVAIDGVDVRQIDPSDLRSRMALVTQEPRLLYGSLRDNLLLATPHATDDELLRVAEITGVKQIAARHPLGFGMPVGERGDTLSGGQKQAIALARALLAKPRVLLLDEPTSGMDMGSERTVLNALRPITQGRTVIIVTHKPALLEFVDRIVIFDDGVKVADGPKEAVIAALNAGKVTTAQAIRAAQRSAGMQQSA